MGAPPLIERQPPRPRWRLVAALVAGAAAGWYLWRHQPGVNGVYPPCVVHQLTGLQCPGCGSLRSVHAALHGRLLESLRDNAMLWATLVLVVVWLGSEWRAGRGPSAARVSPRVVWVYFAALALFTIARNLPFHPFLLLSPAR